MRKNQKKLLPCITSAGLQRDATRGDTGVAIPDEESLIDEMEFRREHAQ